MTARATASGRSWLGVGVRLAVLATAGFAVGVVAGILWEEPGLVVAYLRGNTTEVAWQKGAPLDQVPGGPVVSPPPEALPPGAVAQSSPAPPPVQAAPKPATAPEPPPVAAAPPPPPPAPAAGRMAVQVGAFGESSSAQRLAKRLRARGYPVYVAPGALSGEARWRVRVGPLPDRAEAERVAARLKREEKLPTWVLDEDGS